MFEGYFEEGSGWVPRESLSTPTRRNLRYLERELGYQFDDQARKAKFGHAPSYLIYGTNPQGDEAIYERRETTGRGAGQTFIWEGRKRHRLEEYNLPDLSVRGAERKWAGERRARRKLEGLEGLGVDLEGLGSEETKRISEMLDVMEIPKPEGMDTWWDSFKDPRRGLSEEDRRELRGFLEEYRKGLES